MHGLPHDFDASIFVGHELIQVSFTINTTHIVFDGTISVTLLSSAASGEVPNIAVDGGRTSAASLDVIRLIGKQVASATAESEGTLNIIFQGGTVVTFLDDSRQYESYSIQIGDKEIIV
jgi:hypothetical protein